MNPISCKTRTSKTTTHEKGSKIIFSAQFPVRQTWSTNHFSFWHAGPHHQVAIFKAVLKKSTFHGKVQMKSCSSILRKLWYLGLDECLKRLVSAIAEINESLSMRNECTQENSDDSFASSQILQKQTTYLFYLQKHLENNCDVLPVFGFWQCKLRYYFNPVLLAAFI